MAEANNTRPRYNSFFVNVVDEKRRIQIPSSWRRDGAELELMLVLWPHGTQKDACLLALPTATADELVGRITSMPFGSPDAEALRRSLGRKSFVVTSDRSGRITLPETMAKAVGIEKKAVLVGMLDRFQMWSPERFSEITAGDDALAHEAIRRLL
jgi:MraZ protein